MAHKKGRPTIKVIGSRKERKSQRKGTPQPNSTTRLEFKVNDVARDNWQNLAASVAEQKYVVHTEVTAAARLLVDVSLTKVSTTKHDRLIQHLQCSIERTIAHRAATPIEHDKLRQLTSS